MNIKRIWSMTRLGFRGHVLNWPWRDRMKRRQIRCDIIADEVPRYMKRYLPAVNDVVLQPVIKDDKNEKVFCIWLQGEENAPELVKSCFRSIRRNFKQELIVLDENTLFDYIQLPDYIMEKRRNGQIANPHFADIARVELLYKHGGIWMDATNFATAPVPDEIISQDYFMFLTGNEGSPYSFVQNCFIRARRGSCLLAAWRAMIHAYWKNEPKNYDYFMHQLIFKSLVQKDRFPDSGYAIKKDQKSANKIKKSMPNSNDPLVCARKAFDNMEHIDQDPTHQLAKYMKQPCDKKLFDEITSKTFFQKLTYRGSDKVEQGSFADKIINM